MMPQATAPHLADSPLITSRRGQFWIPGDLTSTNHGTLQRGPMLVTWEAPQVITWLHLVIFVHGGGGQGSVWLFALGGKPWGAAHFVEAGFATYVVDRPGMGRSPYNLEVLGPMGGAFPYEAAIKLFASSAQVAEHTQWPWSREPGRRELDQLLSGFGPLPADLAASQELDAARIVSLLDITGPAVLVTHFAGGPAGWLVADKAPNDVVAIAAIEPMGPPFAEFPFGALQWGLATASIILLASSKRLRTSGMLHQPTSRFRPSPTSRWRCSLAVRRYSRIGLPRRWTSSWRKRAGSTCRRRASSATDTVSSSTRTRPFGPSSTGSSACPAK